MRFWRALDRGNVIEALSSASELEHVGLAEALELCLLLTEQPARFERAALRWADFLATIGGGARCLSHRREARKVAAVPPTWR
jgi:hypothetical protein